MHLSDVLLERFAPAHRVVFFGPDGEIERRDVLAALSAVARKHKTFCPIFLRAGGTVYPACRQWADTSGQCIVTLPRMSGTVGLSPSDVFADQILSCSPAGAVMVGSLPLWSDLANRLKAAGVPVWAFSQSRPRR